MYYLHLNGAQAGPYTGEQIEGMVATNQVSRETLVWTEGQAEWQPLSALFAPIAPVSTLIPLTPLTPIGRPANQDGGKRVLIVVGIVLVVIGVLAVVVTLAVKREYKSYVEHGMELDLSSRAYVDEAIPIILKDWSQEELTKRTSDEFRNATNDKALTKEFEVYRTSGPLVMYQGAKGGTTIQFPLAMATYTARALCKNGEVSILVMLIKKKDKWEILGFVVTSGKTKAVDLSVSPAH